MSSERHLPSGWSYATISDISAYVQRGKSPKYAERSDLPVVNQKCVRWHGVDPAHLKFIHPNQWLDWGPERFLRDGDILWNSTGTGTIGRAAIYHPIAQYPRMVADSHVTIVRTGEYNPRLLHYWISSQAVQSKIDAMQTGSTNQVELSKDQVLNTEVPVPPLNEQRRIVAKIEELTDRSRRAREALDAVPALLDRFRQSVLAAAFRGDLTAEWRAKNPDVEPASELLERIRLERRRRWEEDLRAKGRDPRKTTYEVPITVEASARSALPPGWSWATLDELMARIVDGTHHSPTFIDTGIPFLSVKDIRDERVYFDACKYVSQETHDELSKRCNPEFGDILVTKSGTIGRVAVIRTNQPFSLFVSVALLKPASPEVNPEWISLAFRAWLQTINVKAEVKGSAIKNFHLIDFRRLPLPVPPLAEQEQLLGILGPKLEQAKQVRETLDQSASLLAALDQSILAKAFRGELVPQDPNDEPASVLLERIRGERAEAVVPKAKLGRKPRVLAVTR